MSILPDALEQTPRRKRQRSTSGASESGGSSPKRAASEGPSLTSEPGMRSAASLEPQPFSNLRIIQDHDIDNDAYMSVQGTAQIPASPQHSWTPSQKLAAFNRDVQAPLLHGTSRYMVATPWLEAWKLTCQAEADDQALTELGPVDNSSLVDESGDLKPDLLYPRHYEVVPQIWWDRFVDWCGPVEHVLERKVTTRGESKELFVECYVPRLRIFRLHAVEDTAIAGHPGELWIQISLNAPVREFFDKVNTLLQASSSAVRYWRTSGSNNLAGVDYPVSLLQTSDAELFHVEESNFDKTLNNLLVNPSDVFIGEVKKDGKWLVDSEDIHQADNASIGIAQSGRSGDLHQLPQPQPLFTSGGGFFGEMSDRLGIGSSNKVPDSDKSEIASSSTLKPSPVISLRSKVAQNARTPGTLGLGNLGNTCFMNSAIQCLAHTEELTEYFLSDLYREEINRDNPLGMGGAIAEQFGSLLSRIWASTSASPSYAPREFKQQLQRFAPQFSGYQQHDSQELVAFLLDGLHEDLNRVVKKPYFEKPDWEGGGDKELVDLAQKSWDGYISRNDSAIVDLFQGQYKSTLVCPECQKVSITFDPFMYLTLPLPIKKKWRHNILYIPWDTNKPHLRIPVEVDNDCSFKELRRMLGRWTASDPEHLMTLEVFQCRFYRFLDDSVPVSDMGLNDQILCYELPCTAYLNGKLAGSSQEDWLILPVCTSPVKMKIYTSHYDYIGIPFLIALTREQTKTVGSIYAAIVERLRRWTTNAKSLYKYAGVNHVYEEHVVPITNGITHPSPITEIRENGDIVMSNTPDLEEADIADEKPTTLIDEDTDMVEVDPTLVPIGPQEDLFTIQLLHFTSSRSSMESGTYGTREISLVDRERQEKPLVVPGDLLICKWDETMQSFFLNEHALWSRNDFQDYIHPEYEARRLQEKLQNDLTIEDCLDEFTKEEQLGEDDPWYCPQCKKHQQATKNLQLWKVPDVLVVHLKRFSNSRIMRDKIDAFIDFPLRGLNLETRTGERQSAKVLATMGYNVAELGLDVDEPLLYDLFAVDEHLGGLGGGHYRAYALNHADSQWYHFDDSHVSRCKPEEAVDRNAYLLFYRRRTSRPIGGKTYAKIQAARQSHSEKSVLPTPPQEPSPPLSSQTTKPNTLDDDFSLSQQSWTPSLPLEPLLSSPSPPDLEEGDAPPGLENDVYNTLDDSNIQYAIPSNLNGFQGRATSPTSSSSNEAEDGGSESGTSPPWDKRVADYAPSPPYSMTVLKAASFSPTFRDSTYPWMSGQEPPSPSHSASDFDDQRLGDQVWDSDDTRPRPADQLPSPEPEDTDRS